jgi:hypothetical protein
LPGPTVPFSWLAGAGATNFELWLGSTGVGSGDLYNSGSFSPATTSETVTLPTNGETVYARLYTYINGVTVSTDYR